MTHDEWLDEQASKCTADHGALATTLVDFKKGCYKLLGMPYCDACALEARERFGSTRKKRAAHEWAEGPFTPEIVARYRADLALRYKPRPEPYKSTVPSTMQE